jgi:hypothetical protein
VVTRLRYLPLLTAPVLGAGGAEQPRLGCGCDPRIGAVVDQDGDGVGASVDCNDEDPSIFPGAEEHCDGVDEDCDGDVDEDAVGGPIWYEDLDSDGWGSSITLHSCEVPTGFVAASGDCDDRDPGVHPGARERCCDGVDQDCDETLDNGCRGDLVLLGETGEALAGSSLATLDVDGDGRDDLLVGAPGTSLGDTAEVGQVYVLTRSDALVPGAELLLAEHAQRLSSERRSFGSGVAGLGDLDGDGFEDFAVSSPRAGPDGVEWGAVSVVLGPVGEGSGPVEESAVILGMQGGERLGWGVAGVGDVTGDGEPDLAVSSPFYGRDFQDQGLVTLFSGALQGAQSHDDADARVLGPLHGHLGYALGGRGDIDGDGVDDLLLSFDPTAQGVVGVIRGPIAGELGVDAMSDTMHGDDESEDFGATLGWAGDVDDDGLDDVLVADAHQIGRVYLFTAPIGLGAGLDQASATFTTESGNDGIGAAVLGGFDADGDGGTDLLIAAREPPGEDCPTSAGALYLWFELPRGTVLAQDADWIGAGLSRADQLGSALAVGDWDLDGLDDLAMGAPGTDVFFEDEGAVWLRLGGAR